MQNRARMGRGGNAFNGDLNNRRHSTSERSPATSELLAAIAEFPRNNRGETIRVTINRFGDRAVVDARVCFRAENGDQIPTKKGISLVVDKLPELAEALRQAVAKAEDLGLLKEHRR